MKIGDHVVALSMLSISISVFYLWIVAWRIRRATVALYVLTRMPAWVEIGEIIEVCGLGSSFDARALARDGLLIARERHAGERARARGGRPIFEYQWRGRWAP